jgi:carboxyl-terminal processing protease
MASRLSSFKLPLLLVISILVGIIIGARFPSDSNDEDLVKSLENLREILFHVENDYVDTVDLEKLTEYGIRKMLEELDPHSVYIPPRELEMVQSELRGNFEGIGIEFSLLDDTVYVVAPLSGGPSEKVGIIAGDRIIKVDGDDFAGINLKNSDVINTLRGAKGTEVLLGIKRKGVSGLMDFPVIRDKIPTHSMEVAFMADDQTGYLKLTRFSSTTYDEFQEALRKLIDMGMKNLILDLRDNPGGYLDRAVNIADEFIEGKKVIVFTKSKNGKFDQSLSSGRLGQFETGNLVVLVNEGSASASEIVSGAVQDHDRALIVGRRTFGKGLVQQPIPLRNKGELRLTISRYYVPSGRSIQKPYSKGRGDYSSDIMNRYRNGEFFHQDSIELPDSLLFFTDNGRKVFGGGGIMPDLFVPQDTSDWSRTLGKIYAKNQLREYSYKYIEKNKKRLEQMSFEKYEKDFQLSETEYSEFLDNVKKSDIKLVESDLEKSNSRLKLELKAFIAKSVYGNEAFYKIFLMGDNIYLEAIKNVPKADQVLTKK